MEGFSAAHGTYRSGCRHCCCSWCLQRHCSLFVCSSNLRGTNETVLLQYSFRLLDVSYSLSFGMSGIPAALLEARSFSSRTRMLAVCDMSPKNRKIFMVPAAAFRASAPNRKSTYMRLARCVCERGSFFGQTTRNNPFLCALKARVQPGSLESFTPTRPTLYITDVPVPPATSALRPCASSIATLRKSSCTFALPSMVDRQRSRWALGQAPQRVCGVLWRISISYVRPKSSSSRSPCVAAFLSLTHPRCNKRQALRCILE